MTIRIAIVSRTKDAITAAFYYDVKSKASPKPGFVPAAPNLDQATTDDLKAGAVIEAVREISFSGWPLDQIQAELQKEWAVGQDQALADSAAAADGVGALWDGSAWA